MVEMMSKWGDPVGMAIACLLTIAVFSYLLGDNVLFRLASHIFIGLAAGYVTVLIVYGVIFQQIFLPLLQDLSGAVNIGLVLGTLLGFILLVGRSRAVGRPAVAYLVGVGAATAIGGALFGTIVPQVGAAASLSGTGEGLGPLVVGILALVGTITTLIYFNFQARVEGDQPTKRQAWIEGLGMIGQAFVAITFGVLFAAVFTAALTAFVQRWSFIWTFLRDIVIPFFPV